MKLTAEDCVQIALEYRDKKEFESRSKKSWLEIDFLLEQACAANNIARRIRKAMSVLTNIEENK